MYHASKSAKRALSLQLFQTEKKIEQTQRDIRGIQKALARNTGRYVWGQTPGRGQTPGWQYLQPCCGHPAPGSPVGTCTDPRVVAIRGGAGCLEEDGQRPQQCGGFVPVAQQPTLNARLLSRHSVTAAQLQERLAGAQRELGQLQAQEAGLQREQRKADTHKKMTEF